MKQFIDILTSVELLREAIDLSNEIDEKKRERKNLMNDIILDSNSAVGKYVKDRKYEPYLKILKSDDLNGAKGVIIKAQQGDEDAQAALFKACEPKILKKFSKYNQFKSKSLNEFMGIAWESFAAKPSYSTEKEKNVLGQRIVRVVSLEMLEEIDPVYIENLDPEGVKTKRGTLYQFDVNRTRASTPNILLGHFAQFLDYGLTAASINDLHLTRKTITEKNPETGELTSKTVYSDNEGHQIDFTTNDDESVVNRGDLITSEKFSQEGSSEQNRFLNSESFDLSLLKRLVTLNNEKYVNALEFLKDEKMEEFMDLAQPNPKDFLNKLFPGKSQQAIANELKSIRDYNGSIKDLYLKAKNGEINFSKFEELQKMDEYLKKLIHLREMARRLSNADKPKSNNTFLNILESSLYHEAIKLKGNKYTFFTGFSNNEGRLSLLKRIDFLYLWFHAKSKIPEKRFPADIWGMYKKKEEMVEEGPAGEKMRTLVDYNYVRKDVGTLKLANYLLFIGERADSAPGKISENFSNFHSRLLKNWIKNPASEAELEESFVSINKEYLESLDANTCKEAMKLILKWKHHEDPNFVPLYILSNANATKTIKPTITNEQKPQLTPKPAPIQKKVSDFDLSLG